MTAFSFRDGRPAICTATTTGLTGRRPARRSANRTLRVHDLRHVGAVLAAQSGATTAELMHRLGHTTPQMALRYQHVAEGRDAEIAERLSKLAAGGGDDAPAGSLPVDDPKARRQVLLAEYPLRRKVVCS